VYILKIVKRLAIYSHAFKQTIIFMARTNKMHTFGIKLLWKRSSKHKPWQMEENTYSLSYRGPTTSMLISNHPY